MVKKNGSDSMRFKGNNLVYFSPNFTVIDLETTGRGNQYTEITELSAIRFRNYKPVETYSTLINPKSTILPFVENLTGINNEMVASAPSIASCIDAFVDFIGSDIIVGHNVNFDLNLVYDAYYATYGRIVGNDYFDTLRVSRILNKDISSHKLEALCEYFGINREFGHRGLVDCEQTGELYLKLKKKARDMNLLHVQEVRI